MCSDRLQIRKLLNICLISLKANTVGFVKVAFNLETVTNSRWKYTDEKEEKGKLHVNICNKLYD